MTLNRVLCRFIPICFLLYACQAPSSASRSQWDAEKLFHRVVAIGASASDGFRNGMPLGRLFDEAIRIPHEPLESITSSVFFLDPLQEGERQARLCRARKPSLVIGVDFLFWYGYGEASPKRSPLDRRGSARPDETEEEIVRRLDRLEAGLRLLEELSCPLVLGDFPDMFGADPGMLPARLIPAANALDRLNRKLYAWAKAKPHVLILPLAVWTSQTKAGQARVPGGKSRDPVPAEVLLQEDRLHPSEVGALVLAGRIVKAMGDWFGKGVQTNFRFEVWEEIEKRGLETEMAVD